MRRNLLLALACSLAVTAAAQPTWRFHLAFEDGVGAKDTLWFVYDTTAHLFYSGGQPIVDYDLGEGPTDMSDGLFHVFTLNALMDSTNTVATPYSWYPIFETGNTINAINWTPPMTITWDTSLFHAPYLPYSQGEFGIAIMDGLAFYAISNHPELGAYDMLIDDSVTVDQFSEYLFSFSVYFGEDDHVGIRPQQGTLPPFVICPNPAQTVLNVYTEGKLERISILDLSGRIVKKFINPSNGAIDISSLSPGTYVCRIFTDAGRTWTGRLVVGR